MRQVKMIYIPHLPVDNGYLEMQEKLNEALRDIDSQCGTVKNITYTANNPIGQVISAVIEYDI